MEKVPAGGRVSSLNPDHLKPMRKRKRKEYLSPSEEDSDMEGAVGQRFIYRSIKLFPPSVKYNACCLQDDKMEDSKADSRHIRGGEALFNTCHSCTQKDTAGLSTEVDLRLPASF